MKMFEVKLVHIIHLIYNITDELISVEKENFHRKTRERYNNTKTNVWSGKV